MGPPRARPPRGAGRGVVMMGCAAVMPSCGRAHRGLPTASTADSSTAGGMAAAAHDRDDRDSDPAAAAAAAAPLSGSPAAELHLDGSALQPPTFYAPAYEAWRPDQVFAPADDPDRTRLAWTPPDFLSEKDPRSQADKTVCEELTERVCHRGHTQPSSSAARTPVSFARVVRNVLEPAECAALLRCVNAKGFTPALLNTGGGYQQLRPDVRDGHRVRDDSSTCDPCGPDLPPQTDSSRVLSGAGRLEMRGRGLAVCTPRSTGGRGLSAALRLPAQGAEAAPARRAVGRCVGRCVKFLICVPLCVCVHATGIRLCSACSCQEILR
eukprot:COSAG01_NODE_15817_length_1296_cov_9.121136_1_plen_324_part_00